MKILGMGNALVDVLARIEKDDILKELELPKGSMQLIDWDRLQRLNKILEDTKKHIASGGSAANTITAMSKLGVSCGFLGKVGEDSYAEHFEKDLDKYGVKSHLIKDNQPSGIATTFISADGERTFGTYLGAAAMLDASEVEDRIFDGYNYFYIEGYLVQSIDLIRKAVRTAKNKGLKVILDLASYNVVEANKDFLLEIIPQYVDIVFANDEEAKSLLNLAPESAVDRLAEMTEIAIVKTGDKGSLIKQGEKKVAVPALSVNCLDTTGAGDLYAAGFLYGLSKGMDLSDAGKSGTLLAGNVIQVIGPKMDNEQWNRIIAELPN